MSNYICVNMKYILIAIFFVSTTAKTQTKNNFDWLLGNWKVSSGKGFIIEKWAKQNDSLYIGVSGFVNNKDTIIEETVALKKINNEWFYIPTVAKQNGNKPVSFKLILINVGEFICENIQHDFPQRINYRLFNNNLLASIEGRVKGTFKKVNYDYIKN